MRSEAGSHSGTREAAHSPSTRFRPAARYYELAVELWQHDDPEWPEILLQLARAYHFIADERQETAFENAREAALATERVELAAEADALLAELWWFRGERDACDRHLERAHALVQDLQSSPGKARVLSQVSRYRVLAGADEEAIRIGEAALAMADELGLVEVQVQALVSIGMTRTNMGDADGIEDLERAVAIALAAGSASVVRASHNLAVSVWVLGDLRRGRRLMDAAVAQGERLGVASMLRFSRNVRYWLLAREGYWDEALPYIDEFVAACEAGEPHYHEGGLRLRRAVIRLARDDVQGALEDLSKIVPLARSAGDPQQRVPWLAACAGLLVEAGDTQQARQLSEELFQERGTNTRLALVDLALVAEELGCVDELATIVESGGARTKWTDAADAFLRGDVIRSAELLDEIGDAELESLARLRGARRLVAEGRRAEADEQLQLSLAFWHSVGATRYIRQCEALLGGLEVPA